MFANNGQGVRGDRGAVVRAILSDAEPRGDTPSSAAAGHLREAALFITGVLRGLGAQSDGVFLTGQCSAMGQPVFTPQTVFNFYPPSYQLPRTTTLAPEFFIHNAATALARVNFLRTLIFDRTAPGQLLRGVDLAQIQHVPLHDPAAGHTAVLHYAPVAVLLAVLLAGRGAQEHDGQPLSARADRPPNPRSSLQALPQPAYREDPRKSVGWPARQVP